MNRNSKITLYEHNGPICSAYTNAFIKTGLIDKEDRKNYQHHSPLDNCTGGY